MGKNKGDVSGTREGYEVGVFKNGRLKKIMKMKEGGQYIRHKVKRLKEDKPKRECSAKQLEALAKGRAIREKNRASGEKSKPVRQRATAVRNLHRASDSKSLGHNKKKEKARVRREKEMDTGKFRGHESQYTSDESASSEEDD